MTSSNNPVEWVLYNSDLSTKVAILPYLKGHIYNVFQEPGSGNIDIPYSEDLATTIVSGMFVAAFYRGAFRGGFFVDNIRITEADKSENAGRVIALSGRGLLSILEDAIVWTDGTSATTRTFTNATKASIIKTLITEAQARGGLDNLEINFTNTVSTDSDTWTDSENYSIEVGRSLLDVLRMFAKKKDIEFKIVLQNAINPLLLSAYKNGIGSDYSSSIFLRIGANCEEASSDERGDQIKNALLTKYRDGYISVSDSASIAARRRREDILNIDAAQSGDSAETYAAAQLDTTKDPRTSITLRMHDGARPYVFIDYDIGDTITIDRFGTLSSYRVLGIQADLDEDIASSVVIEVNDIFYDNELETKNALDDLLNKWNTAKDSDLMEVKEWLPLGNPNGEVYALHDYGVYLYIGGEFTSIGTKSISYIASYDTTSGALSSMGTNITSKVVAIMDVSGTLYAATLTKIYKWNTGTSEWDLVGTLGNLATGEIEGMYSNGTNLYVFGNAFTSINGVGMTSNVGYYNGASWTAVGATVETRCYQIVEFNGSLYGAFGLTASGNRGVMKYIAGLWTPVFAAGTMGVTAMTIVGSYLAFVYSTQGLTRTIQLWDGVASSPTLIGTVNSGGGLTGFDFELSSYLSDLYIGDVILITETGTINYHNVLRYSAGNFVMFGEGLDIVSARVRAIRIVGDDVYVGGVFETAGGKSISNLAIWVTSFESFASHLSNDGQFDLAGAIHNAAAAAVSDSDEFVFWRNATKAIAKITWANIKATLKTHFDNFYAALVHTHNATDVNIADAGNYYTGTTVEAALQEVGAGGGGGGASGVARMFYLHPTFTNILEAGAYMNIMNETPYAVDTQSTVNSISSSDKLAYVFATTPNKPNAINIAKGSYNFFITLIQNSGTRTVTGYFKLYKQTSGGAQTLITTSSSTTNITGSFVTYKVTASADEITLAATDRLVLKFYLVGSVSGTDASVNIKVGSTAGERMEMPVLTSIETPNDGWIYVGDSWNRTGNHTFTVSGDMTSVYRKGTKLKYYDLTGADEYGVVGSSSYSAGTTTVNLIVNTDFLLTAGNITNTHVSYMDTPRGFPSEFNYTPAFINFSVGNGTLKAIYSVQGTTIKGKVSIVWAAASPTTSVTGQIYLGLPLTPSSSYVSYDTFGAAAMVDNGVALYMGEMVYSGTIYLELRAILANGTYAVWTATSGTVPFTWGASDRITMDFNYIF